MFCGIPGCGKTTIAKQLVENLQKVGTVKRFTSDELKPPVYEKFFKLLKENLGKFNFLIFDATFYKKRWQKKLVALAKGEKAITVYVYCSLKTAIERNKSRKSHIPEQAIRSISRKMEAPENPEVIINTESLSTNESVEEIIKEIKKVT
ncbi:MAG: ATP-binding protein [Patescibacteria group bacterium]|nr:ATP-binding protein [Patescibacteria group bacterium]